MHYKIDPSSHRFSGDRSKRQESDYHFNHCKSTSWIEHRITNKFCYPGYFYCGATWYSIQYAVKAFR
jgi:hypothetical protein